MSHDRVADGALFAEGLAIRRQVLGNEYVDQSLSRADEFMMAAQNAATEVCWGYAWTRPALDWRTRSLLNLALLTALKAPAELKLHVKGALRNGVTVEQIREALVHATVYCGVPAGLEAFRAAHEALIEAGALPGGRAPSADGGTSARGQPPAGGKSPAGGEPAVGGGAGEGG